MKNYRTLDAMLVLGALVIVGFVFWALVFRAIVPSQLAIISGLAGTLFGATIGAYGGARWGNKKSDEPAPGTVVTTGGTTVTTPGAASVAVTPPPASAED